MKRWCNKMWSGIILVFSSVQSLSHVRLFATPWIAARQASLFITISRSSLRLTSIESVMLSSHLFLCCPLFLLPPIPSSIRVFSNGSTLRMKWPKYWSFSFSIIPFKEIPRLISFRMDWLDLLAVQGTQESCSTLQFKSINSSVLSLLHSPTLTSIHDHRKNHSLWLNSEVRISTSSCNKTACALLRKEMAEHQFLTFGSSLLQSLKYRSKNPVG